MRPPWIFRPASACTSAVVLRPKIATGVKRLKLTIRSILGQAVNHFHPQNFGADPRNNPWFHRIAETGCDLDIRLVDLIRKRLQSTNDDMTAEAEVNRLFLDIFRNSGSVARALNAMMKIGFLERFIPEFARVRFLPQHDVYHQYTVDLHTIAVLENIDSFSRPVKTRTPRCYRLIFPD
jgi:[protein-PII] uridylyltransferase